MPEGGLDSPATAGGTEADRIKAMFTCMSDRTFGRNEGMGRRDILLSPGSTRQHSELIERVWSSPTVFKKATFIDRGNREADSNGLKGGFAKAAKTTSRSELAIERVLAVLR
jgi:hypothetical protein